MPRSGSDCPMEASAARGTCSAGWGYFPMGAPSLPLLPRAQAGARHSHTLTFGRNSRVGMGQGGTGELPPPAAGCGAAGLLAKDMRVAPTAQRADCS